MPLDVMATFRTALAQLEAEKRRIESQIAAIRNVMDGAGQGNGVRRPAPPRRRRKMSAAARRAVSKRMKAYWAKRRAAAHAEASAKGKVSSAKAKKRG